MVSRMFAVCVVVFSVLALCCDQAAGRYTRWFNEDDDDDYSRQAEEIEMLLNRPSSSSSFLGGGDSLPYYPVEDVDLVQPLFTTRLKRQWCRRGMAYNPALGTCTYSVAAMRGRGRKYRRH